MNQFTKDIVFLVADKNTKFALTGILSCHQSLQIKPFTADTIDIYIHPEKDPGCLLNSHTFLRQFANRYAYSIVIFDHSGCGQERLSRQSIEQNVESLLSQNGWPNRASAIVIDPELENWVWSDSPHVDEVLGWSGREPNLKNWLLEKGYLTKRKCKPKQPKEATEAALRVVRMARSSSIYQKLAVRVSLERCVDPAFIKLKTTLQKWFPMVQASP